MNQKETVRLWVGVCVTCESVFDQRGEQRCAAEGNRQAVWLITQVLGLHSTSRGWSEQLFEPTKQPKEKKNYSTERRNSDVLTEAVLLCPEA